MGRWGLAEAGLRLLEPGIWQGVLGRQWIEDDGGQAMGKGQVDSKGTGKQR